MGYIYLIENDINNKKYIGLTTQTIEQRWKQHLRASKYKNYKLYYAMRKYGVEHFYIKEIDKAEDIEELKELEKYWIKYYNTYYNGYNQTFGGEGIIKIDKEEIKKLYKEGKTLDEISKETHHSRSSISIALKGMNIKIIRKITKGKVIEAYNDKGELEKTYLTIRDAAKDTGLSRSCLSMAIKYNLHRKGYFWKIKDSQIDIKDIIKNYYENLWKDRKIKINQYTLEGSFVKTWNSITEAAKFYGCSEANINRALTNSTNSAVGFIWIKNSDKNLLQDKLYAYNNRPEANKKVVYQYSLNGDFISKYNSLTEASKITGISRDAISKAIIKKYTSGNFIWLTEYDEDTVKQIIEKRNNKHNSKKKEVLQFDLNDNYIKTFSSAEEACKFLGKTNKVPIARTCQGYQKTAYGFKWKYFS